MIRLFALCPDRMLSLALSRSRLPLFPSPRVRPRARAFISLRAVQFIPHSRTVRASMLRAATTFNKYRINAFTARRTRRPSGQFSRGRPHRRHRVAKFTNRIYAFYRIPNVSLSSPSPAKSIRVIRFIFLSVRCFSCVIEKRTR